MTRRLQHSDVLIEVKCVPDWTLSVAGLVQCVQNVIGITAGHYQAVGVHLFGFLSLQKD